MFISWRNVLKWQWNMLNFVTRKLVRQFNLHSIQLETLPSFSVNVNNTPFDEFSMMPIYNTHFLSKRLPFTISDTCVGQANLLFYSNSIWKPWPRSSADFSICLFYANSKWKTPVSIMKSYDQTSMESHGINISIDWVNSWMLESFYQYVRHLWKVEDTTIQ